MKKIFLILGVPQSGKTQQSLLLKEYIDAEVISWGKAVMNLNLNKEKASRYRRNDKYLPTEIILKKLKHVLIYSTKENIIIEGFPKYKHEAESLVEFLTELSMYPIEAVININISNDVAFRRISKKAINKSDVDKTFLKEYHSYLRYSKETLKFLHEKTKIFFTVNGSYSAKTINSDIISKLEHKVKTPRTIYEKVSEAIVQTIYGEFKIIAFQSIINYDVHLAVVKGTVRKKTNVPVRVHSSCITGDILGSLKCDCGEQLHKALEYIGKKEFGAVLYLFQEGRGINIVNKLKAYSLQKQGFDTVEANELLGLPAEMREYDVVQDIMDDLQIKSIRLITNNPDKIDKLLEAGVNIEGRIPLEITPQENNHRYLSTKKDKMGHILHIN